MVHQRTDEPTLVVASPIPLMHHDPDRLFQVFSKSGRSFFYFFARCFLRCTLTNCLEEAMIETDLGSPSSGCCVSKESNKDVFSDMMNAVKPSTTVLGYLRA